jgi:hypothetical protein
MEERRGAKRRSNLLQSWLCLPRLELLTTLASTFLKNPTVPEGGSSLYAAAATCFWRAPEVDLWPDVLFSFGLL